MAAAAVLCGNKRSFLFEEDVYPSSFQPKRHRYSSSSTVPPQHVTALRRPAEQTEPEPVGKRTKLTHENLNKPEDWVELFVREMSNATSADDAKSRAAKALEVFEHGIMSRAAAQAEVVAAQKEEENMTLRKEIEEMKKENMKKNERLQESEGRNQELEHMMQLGINQYKEQMERLSKLEVANYDLQWRLKQSQCNTSMPLSFHPHVF